MTAGWLKKEIKMAIFWQADPETFPEGMKAVGDIIHENGLLFGIYSSAGTMTC